MPTAHAAVFEEPVSIAVISENGTGSTSAAQGYVDSLMEAIGRANDWSTVVGKYFTKRSKAKTFIKESKPSFGFLSFGAYLGLRKAQELQPLAVADATATGGAQYFVVSKEHFTLDECRGQALATNHTGDPRFIDAVVSGDAFDLSDFTVVETKRPVQTLKAVIDGEAACALVDDAQVVAMSKIDGGAMLHPVWGSEKLPAIVVVSFGSAAAKQVESFKGTIEAICEGNGKDVCDAAGLKAPRRVETDAFAAQQTAYDG
ncbi:hypothetical protein [Paraliomyxa miuraensis]|uniref:hypothetical protein n=1 Tax=Paraliomyxa miuraensis TaxID=376150 RepID=UPI00224D78F9|nr:hypothetical protein [Paraliomyxa miuraensis]MCX4245827.1 hypothetical protein [Paraliomyxa miuraensis]